MTPLLLTHDATLDDLSAADYVDIFAELRQNNSLADVVALMQSALSRATWNNYEHGKCSLSRQMRNDLRRAVGKELLPMTVNEAVGAASPDATVWSVGDGIPQHVIMVDDNPVTLHVNGGVTVAQNPPTVTEIRPQVTRKAYIRPCVPLAYAERLQALQSVSWLEVIEAGLEEFEK